MRREMFAEFLGATLLASAVIGSGIMAERLADGNAAIALLGNTAATVAVLGVLIAMLAPVSGAHFNPVVTLVALTRKQITGARATAYAVAQIVGCCARTRCSSSRCCSRPRGRAPAPGNGSPRGSQRRAWC